MKQLNLVHPRITRLGCAFILILVIAVSCIGVSLYTFSIFTSPMPFPKVTITSPPEGSKVPILVTVQGMADDIPQDAELWLFVRQGGGSTGYFPQPGPITVYDGTWKVTAYIGQQNGSVDVGKKFFLIAALVYHYDKEAKDAIQAYFKQTGRPHKGIASLPGIDVLDSISVIRT